MEQVLDIIGRPKRRSVPMTSRPATGSSPSWWAALAPARRTRIVCTLGPASTDRQTLRSMVAAGMDIARFNFSHGSHEIHRALASTVREVAVDLGRPVALMQDLQGPKLRIGALAGRGFIELVDGEQVEIRAAATSTDPMVVPVPHRRLVRALQPHDRVLLGDGEIELLVRSCSADAVSCVVVRGGRLADRKGITAPGRYFPMPILTRKDLSDLAFGRTVGFDLLAVSFVRTGADMDGVRKLTRELGWEVPLVAKLETQEALSNLGAILAASDAVMVARGDLGVQLPLTEVPAAQKEIIRRANLAGLPVITATQMLESMVTSTRPTRAEATDVANAVWDGTDAVMLSAETSAGRHPVPSIQVMSDLCLAAEASPSWRRSAGPGWAVTPGRAAAVTGGPVR